jgi:nucleotide-binding universal stress UspA family protein
MIPPRAILAAVSFSDSSRVALVLAARLARHCDAELHVLHVEDPLLDAAARYEGIDLSTETSAELQRFVAGAWPAAQCLPKTHVLAGAAVDVILDVAHRHRADLVVVDSGRMSSAERRVFGSTTEGLLRRADVSVLVAPAEWTPPQPDAPDLSDLGPLVVVVDLADPRSVPATKAACELASVLGTSVEIVHFVPDREASEPGRSSADSLSRRSSAHSSERWRTDARAELEFLIRELGCSVPVEIRVEAGAVAHRLAEAAGPTRNRAPILVLGKTAPSSKGGWSGAIVNRVLSGGTVPVLMYVADQIAQI